MKSSKNIALSIGLLAVVFYILGTFSNASSDVAPDFSAHFSKSQHSPKFLHSTPISLHNIANVDTKDIEEEETEEEASAIAYHTFTQISLHNQKTKCIDNNIVNVNQHRNLYLHFENFRL